MDIVNIINSICHQADQEHIQYFDTHRSELVLRKMDSPLVLAHMLAQFAHETGGFKDFTERLSLKRYTIDSERFLYRGRGMIQLTGKSNYKWIGGVRQLDYVNNPELVSQPGESFYSAIEWWSRMACNKLALQDNVTALTRRINGGFNGLDERVRYTKLFKEAMKVT